MSIRFRYSLLVLFLAFPMLSFTPAPPPVFPALETYIRGLSSQENSILPERKAALTELLAYIREKQRQNKPLSLVFICTHNSRRSHFGQIWASVLSRYYGIPNLEAFSGGTEATACNPRTIAALERAGFRVENPGGTNPRYRVSFSESSPPMTVFSKRYQDPANPQKDFAAIMTCSEADAACPLVPGADFRLPLPFEDPKVADQTPAEAARYDERCRQIAVELNWVFARLK